MGGAPGLGGCHVSRATPGWARVTSSAEMVYLEIIFSYYTIYLNNNISGQWSGDIPVCLVMEGCEDGDLVDIQNGWRTAYRSFQE